MSSVIGALRAHHHQLQTLARDAEELADHLDLNVDRIELRDLLLREPRVVWRELLPIYRRLEARGELRGGRFVAGFIGEQFALPEAVESLRAIRAAPKTGEQVVIAASDPLKSDSCLTQPL